MISIQVDGLEALQAKLNQLGNANLPSDLNNVRNAIGAEVESQTKRRISDEKTAPDGTAWQDWSENYAATRHGGHSLLEGDGHLYQSIGFHVSGGEVEVGSNLEYAATQQLGSRDGTVPARPYLGVSDDNEQDLVAIVDDFITSLLAA